MQLCVGTSLAIIVPTTIRSYLTHKAKGAVIPNIVRIWALPAIGVAVGSVAAAFAPGSLFKITFVVFASLVSLKMILGRESWNFGTQLPGRAVLTGHGFITGLTSPLTRNRTNSRMLCWTGLLNSYTALRLTATVTAGHNLRCI